MATKFRASPYGGQAPAAQNQFIYNNAPHTNDQMEFAFRKRFEKIDWRRIASADVDHITRTLDFDTLQDNIANIAFCDIEQELDMQNVDPNYVKLFQLSQLTIEYLLHSQDYLMKNLQETQSFVATLTDELNKVKSSTEALQKELSVVKAESHKRKKIITTQQMLLQNGKEAYNRCAFCSKAFINQTFLEAHVQKRHAGKLAAQRATESAAVVHVTSAPVPTSADAVELDAIRKRLQQTESRLAQEVDARRDIEDQLKANAAEVERKMRSEITAWQENVRAEHERDLQRYMRELTETNEKLRIAEAALQKKMETPLDNYEMMELRRQREDNALFREELLAQKAELEKREAELMRKNMKDFDSKLKRLDGTDTMQDIFIQSASGPSNAAAASRIDRSDSRNERKPVPPAAKRSVPSDRNSQQRGRDREMERDAPHAASGLKDVASVVAEMSDGEIESEDESAATFTGLTLPTYDGNLSLTDDGRQEKLRRELEQNPELVKSAREQVIFELEAALEKRGIRRDTLGINDQLFGTLANALKTERTKLAKDIKNFYDVRNQLMNAVDSDAKAKHAATVSSAAATPQSARSAPPGPAAAPVAGRSAAAAATLPAQRSSAVTATGAAGQPRGSANNNNNRTGTTMSNTRQSATLADSTTFTSGTSYSHSDSFGSDTEADLTVSRDPSPPPLARRDAGAQVKTGSGSQVARATSVAVPPPGLDRANENLSDFDEDSMSELEAAAKPVSRPVSMPPSAAPSSTGPRLGIGVGQPASGMARGGNVNHSNNTPRSTRNSDEMSLRTVSSIDDAGVNVPQPTYSSIYRQPAQSSKLPSTSGSLKGKSLGNSVRFSDELESIGDD